MHSIHNDYTAICTYTIFHTAYIWLMHPPHRPQPSSACFTYLKLVLGLHFQSQVFRSANNSSALGGRVMRLHVHMRTSVMHIYNECVHRHTHANGDSCNYFYIVKHLASSPHHSQLLNIACAMFKSWEWSGDKAIAHVCNK